MAVTKISKGRIAAGGVDLPGASIRTAVVDLAPTADALPVASGVKIPAGSIILDAYVEVESSTAGTTAYSLNAGTSAATIGYITGLSIAMAGAKRLSCASGGVTRGALLRETVAGAAASVKAEAAVDAETEIYYSTSVPVTAVKGRIIVDYRKL